MKKQYHLICIVASLLFWLVGCCAIQIKDVPASISQEPLENEEISNSEQAESSLEAEDSTSVTITEMALSPKSNSAYSALHDAIKDIESGNNYPIPETIRIDSTIYKYPHDYKGSFVVQQYMPDNLINKIYYKPKLTSKYEQNLALIDQRIKKIKEQSK
jgi:replication-associated recombination protein RarA